MATTFLSADVYTNPSINRMGAPFKTDEAAVEAAKLWIQTKAKIVM